ncbi:MAG: hypothetical protein NT116_06480, partial [Candidatus Parcubacteria bacterium]|nr:hypothetical protein [Candidatus Parcubacteria bacterium]
MAGNKKKYCSKMKLDCEYFFICQKMPDDNLNLKKIKKILSKLDISNILMLKTKRKIIKHEFLTDSQARFFINKYKKLGLKVVVLR